MKSSFWKGKRMKIKGRVKIQGRRSSENTGQMIEEQHYGSQGQILLKSNTKNSEEEMEK